MVKIILSFIQLQGIKQWGSLYIPKDQKLQFVYPITFISTAFAIALSNEGTSNTSYASAFSDLTNSSVYLADNAATVHCIIVGVQQWGFSANPVTYPIAFNEKTLLVCGLTFDQQSTHSPNLYQNLTTKTGFPWERYTGVGSYKVSYIAFGYQQWGTADERKSNISQTIHFPIAFSNTSYGFVLGEINIYQADTIGSRVLSKTMSNMVIFGWDYTTTSWLVLGIQQWGESDSNANSVAFPLSVKSTNYLVFVGFKDFVSDEVPRFAYMASTNRTTTGFKYGQTTTVIRLWFSLCLCNGDC